MNNVNPYDRFELPPKSWTHFQPIGGRLWQSIR